MIRLTEDFIKHVDKCGTKLKSKILSKICQLPKFSPHTRVGKSVATSEKLQELKIDDQYRLMYKKKCDQYVLFYIWDHNHNPPSNPRKESAVRAQTKHSPKSTGGFEITDFNVLRLAFETPMQISLKHYFEKIKEQIFPKFNKVSEKIQSRLKSELGVELFPHEADMADIGKDPVVWLAYTRSEQEHYEGYAQLTFHIGIGHGIHDTEDIADHFCIKCAVFHNKPDIWRFQENIEKYPSGLETIKEYAKKLHPSYNMMFLRKKEKFSNVYPVHSDDDVYSKLFIDLIGQESIDQGFFAFTFFRNYPYHDPKKHYADLFADMERVENEILMEFSNLMYLYFWFVDDNPIERIKEYNKRKIEFDDKYHDMKRITGGLV